MLSVGLVGLPNAGKSTLFNLLTKRSVPAENFPFCTIDPNVGIVEVFDERIKNLARLVNAKKEIYAAIEFKDIAGLVKGASTGAGLGNKFLSHIRECDMILMVVRCFQHGDVIHVENRVNPSEDDEILMIELTMSDTVLVEKLITKLEKDAKTGKEKFVDQKMIILESILQKLNKIEPAISFEIDKSFDPETIKWRKSLNLLTDKPILRLGNIIEGAVHGTNLEYSSDIKMDIALEASVVDLTADERKEMELEEISGLTKMIQKCFETLDMSVYLTAGEIEARAWPFKNGLNAKECAGVIHSDFTDKFIKAEIIKYTDFITLGNRKNAIEKGKVSMEGKEYLMQDGDVVEFKIGN